MDERINRVFAQLLLLLVIPTNKGMSDRVDRKCDAVLHSYLSHELGHVRLHSTFLDGEGLPNFSIGTSGD